DCRSAELLLDEEAALRPRERLRRAHRTRRRDRRVERKDPRVLEPPGGGPAEAPAHDPPGRTCCEAHGPPAQGSAGWLRFSGLLHEEHAPHIGVRKSSVRLVFRLRLIGMLKTTKKTWLFLCLAGFLAGCGGAASPRSVDSPSSV